MKARLLLPLLVACSSAVLLAEPAGGGTNARPFQPSGDAGKNGAWRDKLRDKMLEHLPPELRKRFEAARDKAMQDPAIQELKKKADAAGEEFRAAMRDAMMKADPGLADLLKEKMKDKFQGGKDGHRPDASGFANLSESDRQKLMAAREKAKNDPAVQAAEAKKKDAKTPEQRQAAMEEFHQAMKQALLKEDPTIGPILDQLKPPQGPPPATGAKMGAGA
jgi:hypothetical protein